MFGKFGRFAMAGLTSTLCYGLFSVTISSALPAMGHLFVHFVALAMAVPVSYFLQKRFTFRHHGRHRDAAPRFLSLTLVSFVGSTAIMYLAVDVLGFDALVGVAAVMVSIPMLSFAAMLVWVFAEKSR